MDRRIFLTWMGLSFFASTSVAAIASIIDREDTSEQSPPMAQTTAQIPDSSAEVFYVAPNGNDNWSGALETVNSSGTDGPFATLQRARDAIRSLKRLQGGTLQKPVTVLLRGGTYFLTEPLTLKAEDSGTENFPITYTAYPGEQPIISGGQKITDWQQQGNFWTANLPQVQSGEWYFRLLRVGQKWANRARYPKLRSPDDPNSWLYIPNRPTSLEEGNFNSSVASVQNRGDKLEWRVNIPTSGQYRVWLRYSNNMQAYGVANMGGRTVLQAGNNAPVVLQDVPDTGSFQTFQWHPVATLDLRSGEQTLTWENIKGGGLGLDAFCLTDDFDWNPANAIQIGKGNNPSQIKQPRSGKHLVVIHAETFNKSTAEDLVIVPKQQNRDRIIVAEDKFPNWQNWENAEVEIFPTKGWVNAILPVNRVEPESNSIYVSSKQDLLAGNRFCVVNVREALNRPGEWCLDSSRGELVYFPIESDPNNVEVVAPKLDRLIEVRGDGLNRVTNISLQGLTFTDTNYNLTEDYYVPADAAIWLSATRQFTIENCNFVRLGGHAIRLEQSSQENRLVRNTMSELGQGGVLLLGNNATQPVNNLIAANDIQDCGKVYKHVAGVYVSTGSNNRIAHNSMRRLSRYGISLKSFSGDRYSHNNIVEYNEVIDSNLETSDTGAIETLGRDKQLSGNIIRYNFIRNVIGLGTNKQGKIISPYFNWGIYLDDYSSGTTVLGNVVIDTVLGGICVHGGKNNSISHNMFFNGSEMQIRLQPKDSFMTGNTFSRNIVVYNNPEALLWFCYDDEWQRDRLGNCDYNLYWHAGNLNLANTNKKITPEGSFAQWQAAGLDRNSVVSQPPLSRFITANISQFNKQDFQLQQNSVVFQQLGLETIPVENIGIEGFRE